MNRHLVIFARQIRVGAGKRRLAAGIGPVGAASFQRRTLTGLLRRVADDPRWRTWIALTPDTATAQPQRLIHCHDVTIVPQGPGDLGQRMARMFRILPPGPLVLIGSDIPAIQRRHIAHAFSRLGGHDAVFGPADDGGYWLVGLKRLRPTAGPNCRNLFSNVRWSTEHALSDTVAGLPAGTSISYLDTLSDIDTADDLARWDARRIR